MLARYILAVLAIAFLVAGAMRFGTAPAQSRTWLLLGAIFGAVSTWLFYQG